jgi:NADH-quinone oxidoreductase subunit H
MQELIINLCIYAIKIGIIFGFAVAGMVPVMIYLERRIVAFFQQRIGPNRVGPFGILQPFADALKLILKEEITPAGVDKILYYLAPGIVYFCAIMNLAIIPFGPDLHIFGRTIGLYITDLGVGILYLLAVSSMGVYGIVLAGWSSNSKYSLIGGLRSTAQMISYELAMGMAIVGIIMSSQSLSLVTIVNQQVHYPFILTQFIGFFIFTICMIAETNRSPFDLPEAESELVAGFHTEYTSMKFAIFFMAEYVNMVTMSCIVTTLYLGGWRWPIADPNVIVGVGQFMAKVVGFLFLYIWLRATLPRFRYDQLMKFGWLVLLPLGILNVLLTGLFLSVWGK